MASSSPKHTPPTFDDLERGIVKALDAADKEFAKFINKEFAKFIQADLNTVYEQGPTISENLDYLTLNHTNGDWYGLKHKAKK